MGTFDHIRTNARQHEDAMLDESRAALDGWGADAKQIMRERAPWTDRTGQARFGHAAAGIYPSTSVPQGRGLTYVAIHPTNPRDGGRGALVTDAPYGFHLETTNGSDYAVIMPTLATEGPRLLHYMREIWR
jgi:hypothetical protein